MAVKRETILIADATIDQMQRYLLEAIGDTVPDDMPIAEMRSKIKSINSGKESFSLSADEPMPDMSGQPPKRIAPVVLGANRAGDTNAEYADGELFVEVQVQTSDKEGGEAPVQVGVNGVAMLIPRGQPVMIKVKYLAALANAVQLHAEVDADLKITGYRKVHTYPFSIIRAPREVVMQYGRTAA